MAPPPGILEVQCAGCGGILEVEHGLTEFACPDCGTAQELPPELKPPRPRRALPLPGRVAPSAAPVRVACGGCGSMVSMPHGPGRFACSLCGTELATFPATAVPVVVTPPAAVPLPITPTQPLKPSEVQDVPSSQSARAGKIQKHVHLGQAHIEHPKHYISEDSFNSLRDDTSMHISAVGRLQNDPPTISVHREESYTELPSHGTITRAGNPVLQKKYRFVVGPKSCEAGKAQEDHPNRAVHASQAQELSSSSSVHKNQAKGLPSNTIMHDKKNTQHVAVLSSIEHEQIGSLHQDVNRHQAGDIPKDLVHVDKEKVDLGCRAKGNSKKSTKDMKRNQKRKNMSLMSLTNEWSHLRRSKRLSNLSPDLIDTEPTRTLDAPLNRNQLETQHNQSAIADPDPSALTHQGVSNELNDVDETTPSGLNHGILQTEQFPHCYSQMYSPETEWVLPDPTSHSWHEHEIPQKSCNGIDQLGRSDEEVRLSSPENLNQYMDGHVAEEACSGKNHSEQLQVKPHSENFAEHGSRTNLSASCSRLAALLPVRDATIASLSSLEKLPFHCSSPKTPHHQPRSAIDYKDAQYSDMLSGSLSKSSEKRRGRRPAVLMEPREEVDRPVLMPNGTENWTVHPPCPKVSNTLSILIKQNYPGTYVSEDTNGKPSELVVHYWHQYPLDIRATVMDEFLKRYKWSPGHEEECQKIFNRKAVRQLVNLFCYEKQRVREELSARKGKRSLVTASRVMTLEEGDGSGDLEGQQGDESVVALEHDDPLKWKPSVPKWMKPTWWEMLCDHWSNDEYRKLSFQQRKNRNAGNHPRGTAGSRSIGKHQCLSRLENGRELLSDIDPCTKSGEKGVIGKTSSPTEVGRSKPGWYDGASVAKKTQIDSLSKSSQGCLSTQEQQSMFTQDQVQQMISQALQGLNETWENKFLSLEQSMHRMSSSHVIPVGAKGSAVAVAGDEHCQLACQDTMDSLGGEKVHAATTPDDAADNHDEDRNHRS